VGNGEEGVLIARMSALSKRFKACSKKFPQNCLRLISKKYLRRKRFDKLKKKEGVGWRQARDIRGSKS